jgi:methionyl-tRNA formyltransferase
LPRNKGRHPLHWLIVLGKKKSMMSFFKMNEVIDGGDILIQEQFDVGKDINEANSQMIDAGKKGLEKLIKLLKEKPNYIGNTIQKESGNYLRKRDIHDITIDPRMTSNVIKKIVNSFCYPYPLARLYYQKNSFLKIIKINELSDDECSRNWKDYEHGYIFKVNHNSIDIRVDNMVLNMEIEVNNIDVKILLEKKIHPPAYYFNSDS